MTVDPATGKIYVADTQNHRVQRFMADGQIDTSFGSGGVLGNTATVEHNHTGFDRPTAVAIHPSTNEVYVADFGNQRIEVFDSAGTYQRTFLAVYRATDLAFNAAGDLYITGEDPNNGYPKFDGRLRVLRAGRELISDHFTGGLDDLSRRQNGVAIRLDGTILLTDAFHGRVVTTDMELTEAITDLEVDAQGNQVIWRWRTELPTISQVRYGVIATHEHMVTDGALTTEHEITVAGLTPNTRLVFDVAFTDPFDGLERFTPSDAINTGVSPGQHQFLRIKAAGVIYTDTDSGEDFEPIDFQMLMEAHKRFDAIAEFYWRNSGFRLWPDIEVVEVNRNILEEPFSVFGEMESDLATRGYGASDDFDALWGTSLFAGGNNGGGAIRFGRPVGESRWVTQNDFIAIHEVNHTIDSIYDFGGLDKYEFSHGLWAVPGTVGRDIAVNSQIVRNLLPANFTALRAPFTKIFTAPDADNDGVPDSSPAGLIKPLAITEASLGTSTASADSDGDGLTDFQEATLLAGHGSNPNLTDTDGDGLLDGVDMQPAYAAADRILDGSPTIDGVINAVEGWTVFTDGWGFSNERLVNDSNDFQDQSTTYLAWDEQFLYLALTGPASTARVELDGGADNHFLGADNYRIMVSNEVDFVSVKVNVGVPDLFRQIDDSGEFSCFFDTDDRFTQDYQGVPFSDSASPDGPGFEDPLVTIDDLQYQRGGSGADSVWELAIPWSDVTGLRGEHGKRMAISLDFNPVKVGCDLTDDNSDRLFESDHAAVFTLISENSGDFDFDSDVDGFDFLAWQRGVGTIYDASDLANWEAQYGTEGLTATVQTSDNPVLVADANLTAQPATSSARLSLTSSELSGIAYRYSSNDPSKDLRLEGGVSDDIVEPYFESEKRINSIAPNAVDAAIKSVTNLLKSDAADTPDRLTDDLNELESLDKFFAENDEQNFWQSLG